MARPLIARKQVEVARRVGADALAHGCTGKGNDQVRFELTYMSFAPDLPVIAPWRVWDIRSREDALAYAAAHNVPVVGDDREDLLARPQHLAHLARGRHPRGSEQRAAEGSLHAHDRSGRRARDAGGRDDRVRAGHARLRERRARSTPSRCSTKLNEIGGRHGIGRADIVEDRLVGMKSRGVYETPGGTLLYTAHSELEMLVLDRRTLAAKDLIAPRYADLVYEGRWWTTEREAYDAFVNVTQGRVTGTITLRLCRGTVTIAGRESEDALYDERFVTFGEDDVYEQSDAAGFIRLFGLAQRVRALKDLEASWRREGRAGAQRLAATETGRDRRGRMTPARRGRRRVGGRRTSSGAAAFRGGPHPALDAVNRSIGVDFRLWPHDVRLSKAWAVALAHAGVLTRGERARIAKGLDARRRAHRARREAGRRPTKTCTR